MATRLEITHGLIAERERSATSADALSVTRPTTGSTTRSKGILSVLVSSTLPGPRAREASMLVLDTIRHDYYYDESAGVPVCLEKAIRAADRRLAGSREAAGLLPGALGIAAAVIRGDELYLATLGPVDAYLVRNARLLMPERTASTGLPAGGELVVDVWRGELDVSDALLMVSRNVTETVGTEELKSAVLTLHPQAAVDHLHHLFMAAGGAGSDGLIAVEASELTTRMSRRLVPATAGDVFSDLPGVMAGPVGSSAGTSLFGHRGSLAVAFNGFLDRLWDAVPRRDTKARRLRSRMSQAETRRRAALGIMALVATVAVVGLIVILGPRPAEVTQIPQVASGDSALSVALDRTDRADNLSATEPDAAIGFYREAWAEIERARQTGLSAPQLDMLEARVTAGLDRLYGAIMPVTTRLAGVDAPRDPTQLVQGPLDGAYYIDSSAGTVVHVNPRTGKSEVVVREGDKPTAGSSGAIGRPVQLEAGGPDVIIVDDDARPWRWRPSNKNGRGTLIRLTLLGGATFDEDHGDVAAYSTSAGGYRLYVVEPSRNQIMRYQQTFDGSAFQVPTAYLVTPSEEVADFEELHVDFDIYALLDSTVRRYRYERYDGGFALAEPPDVADLRPQQDYQLLTGTGTGATGGLLYLYDADYGRIVAFDKTDGSYVAQWIPGPDDPQMTDVRGMYVVPGKKTKKKQQPDTLVWVSPEGVFESVLPTSPPAPPSEEGVAS